jgi:type IV pilus assembly protein PilN
MIRINLLPVREARRKAGLRQQVLLLAGAAAFGLVGALVLHLSVEARISSTRGRIAHAEAEFAKLQETLAQIEEFRARKEEIQRKLTVIAELEKSRTGPVRILDEIATRIPDRLWLSHLSMRNGVVELRGYGLDNEIIAAFMTSLEESEFMTSVELVETHLELDSKKTLKLNSFKIRSRDTRYVPAAMAGNGGRR